MKLYTDTKIHVIKIFISSHNGRDKQKQNKDKKK